MILETVGERQGKERPEDGQANRRGERGLCPWILRVLSTRPCPS